MYIHNHVFFIKTFINIATLKILSFYCLVSLTCSHTICSKEFYKLFINFTPYNNIMKIYTKRCLQNILKFKVLCMFKNIIKTIIV